MFVIGLAGLGLAGVPPAVAEEDRRSRTTAATEVLAQEGGERRAAAATQLSIDTSGQLMTTGQGPEAAGDFLGLGYDQPVKVSDGKIIVLDHPSRGGSVLSTYSHDALRNDKNVWDWKWYDPSVPWDYRTVPKNGKQLAESGLLRSHVAVTPGNIWFTVGEICPTDGPYNKGEYTCQSSLMRLGSDGTFTEVDRLAFAPDTRLDRALHSALATGEVNGKWYVAAGLSQYGVDLFDAETGGKIRRLFHHWNDFDTPIHWWERKAVTALAFGEYAPGKTGLAVGKIGYGDTVIDMVDDSLTNRLWGAEWVENNYDELTVPMSFDFGSFDGKNRTLAAGLRDGEKIRLYDAATGARTGQYDGVGPATSVRFFTGSDGTTRLAAAFDAGGEEDGRGEVLEKTGDRLKAVPLDSKGNTYAPVRDLEDIVPGYRALNLTVRNATGQPISAQFSSSPTPDAGCWLNTGVGSEPGIGNKEAVIAAGSSSPTMFTSFSTLAPDGACNDPLAERSFYLSVWPQGETSSSSLRETIKLTWQDGELRPESAGGARFSASVQLSDGGRVLGAAVVTIDAVSSPQLVTAPDIEGRRLTPAPAAGYTPPAVPSVNDPNLPIFRFTVTGAQWSVQGADAGLSEAVLPLLEVRASTDGQNWTSIGSLASPQAPSRAGDMVTSGSATFDWQKPAKGPDYKFFTVGVGETWSASPVAVDELLAPAAVPYSEIASVKWSPQTGGMAPSTVRNNGLDQAPVRPVIEAKANGLPISPSDPDLGRLYDQLIFRNSANELITGLIDPARYSTFKAVTPIRGQFANDGERMSAAAEEKWFYYSAAGASTAKLTVQLPAAGTDKAHLSNALDFTATQTRPTADTGTNGTQGVGFGNCPTACEIANPGGGPVIFEAPQGLASGIGVQFRALATTSMSSLPILSSGPLVPDGGHLTAVDMILDVSRASVKATDFNKGDRFVGSVVIRGDRVIIPNLLVELQKNG